MKEPLLKNVIKGYRSKYGKTVVKEILIKHDVGEIAYWGDIDWLLVKQVNLTERNYQNNILNQPIIDCTLFNDEKIYAVIPNVDLYAKN